MHVTGALELRVPPTQLINAPLGTAAASRRKRCSGAGDEAQDDGSDCESRCDMRNWDEREIGDDLHVHRCGAMVAQKGDSVGAGLR